MPQRATEIATLPLNPGTSLTAGETGKIWQEAVLTIAAQPGNISVQWGIQIENPDVVQFVIDWTDIQDHKNFIASPGYKPFLESLGTLLSGPPTIFHAHLPPETPFPSGPGSAPITECLVLYFPPSHSTSDYDKNFAAFQKGIKEYEDLQGVIGGWVVEELEHEKVEGGKARGFAAFLGWPSVEAHQGFRESEVFKENIGVFREGWKGAKMVHVGFTKAGE